MNYPVSVRIQVLMYVITSAALLIVDRITKLMALGLEAAHPVTSFLSYELVLNRGISWGMLHSDSPLIFGVISCLIVLIICGIIAHAIMRLSAGHWVWAEVLIVSGALSNMIDRVIYGGVVDFIHVAYAGWSFPVFNVADMAVVVGVAILFWEFYHE